MYFKTSIFNQKAVLFFLVFFQLATLSFGQVEDAFEFEAAVTGDVASNMVGGVKQGVVYLGNIDLQLTFDTEKAKLWKGGTFFAYGLNNHGKPLSGLVGDLQVTNNIEADANTRLYELWYQQKFGKFAVTVGQHDLNSEFAVSETALVFLQSSFGFQPDISTNPPVSQFPVATVGVFAKWEVSDRFTIIGAVYDGNPGDEVSNPNSVNVQLKQEEGAMTIAELQYTYKRDSVIKGTYKLGLWNHTATAVSLSDPTKEYKNDQGFYFIADQLLLAEVNDLQQGLMAFGQVGFAPKDANTIASYIGGGVRYKGFFKKRDEDELALAVGHVFLSDAYKTVNNITKDETVIELTYNMRLNKYFSIQPDLQYVITPSGNAAIDDALIGAVRVKLEF